MFTMGLNGCPLLPTTCEESSSFVLFCFFKVFKHNFIYSFLALVGLSWLWQVGSTPIVCGLLTMVASLVTERGL